MSENNNTTTIGSRKRPAASAAGVDDEHDEQQQESSQKNQSATSAQSKSSCLPPPSPSPSTSTSTSTSLAEGRTRRKGSKVMKCPICLKTFYRAVMSLSDINDHINRCSDAQLNYEKLQHHKDFSQSQIFLKKLKIDSHGNVRKDTGELLIDKTAARRTSMESLKNNGELQSSFEYLLMKHLDP